MNAVPCNHYWLEVAHTKEKIVALCKYRGCQKRAEFTAEEWKQLANDKCALNMPVRI